MTTSSLSPSNQSSNPEIYVACLAAYNNGHLHGAWIDATQDIDDIASDIKAMLAASPEPDAEEYEIHDSNFEGCIIDKGEELKTVHAIAHLIVEHGEVAAKLYNDLGYITEVENALEDCNYGEWGSESEFGENFFDDLYLYEIPEHLQSYIDYDRFTRDLFLSGDFFSIEIGYRIHVFSAH